MSILKAEHEDLERLGYWCVENEKVVELEKVLDEGTIVFYNTRKGFTIIDRVLRIELCDHDHFITIVDRYIPQEDKSIDFSGIGQKLSKIVKERKMEEKNCKSGQCGQKRKGLFGELWQIKAICKEIKAILSKETYIEESEVEDIDELMSLAFDKHHYPSRGIDQLQSSLNIATHIISTFNDKGLKARVGENDSIILECEDFIITVQSKDESLSV